MDIFGIGYAYFFCSNRMLSWVKLCSKPKKEKETGYIWKKRRNN